MWSLKRARINRCLKKIKALQKNRRNGSVEPENIKKEIALYYKLIKLLSMRKKHKKIPFATEMILECYRAAAALEDAQAHYLLGKYLIEEARFREELKKQGIFASSSNARQMQQRYDEALAHLSAGEKLGHALARRLRGLCYINAWGVEQDKKFGFDLIVESIKQENSWDKVPQIFAAIGLNTPEFFSALTEYREKDKI